MVRVGCVQDFQIGDFVMSNPWFRLYSEFSHDPKVQMMTEVMQRRYIMILCLRCSNTLVTLHETEVAFHLRISDEELAETKALFIEKGFIDPAWNLLNWEKRQFASDTSKARVAKHRALQKAKQSAAGNSDVTLPKRNVNALDTDTDTDKKKEDKSSFRAKRLPTDFMPDLEFAKSEGVDGEREFEKFRDYWSAQGAKGAKSDWPATWRNWCRNAKKPPGVTPMPKANTRPKWVLDAGFTNIHEANNEGCFERNAHEFQAGKRSEVAA